ncbi:hypothetical protein [Nostoc sp. CALU 546]|uniref:hypothetical protein n=1 Tax=Nostoc sp. CALU 546 TaxID=1867241 RepID=UPI003B66ED8F
MPLNFTFALSQQQTFELRCDYGSRRLDKTELAALIDLCEQNYYPRRTDNLHWHKLCWMPWNRKNKSFSHG